LDTTARLGRFVFAECAGRYWAVCRNRWFATVVTVIPAVIFGLGAGYKVIWPVFGATNQLIAGFALLVVSFYLLGVRRPTIYSFIPAVFMMVTTVTALCYQMVNFFKEGKMLLAWTSVVLIGLALFVLFEVANRRRLGPRPVQDKESV